MKKGGDSGCSALSDAYDDNNHRHPPKHRVEFRTGEDIDDAEWFFVDPDSDAIIEFRAARRGDRSDGGANARRLEKIRIALGFEKVPVLRNRRRALFIMESPLDAFGPSYGVDAPPPQEVSLKKEGRKEGGVEGV